MSATGCTSSDHCRGIELILEKGRPGEVYNIGGGAESENLKLIDAPVHGGG